MSFRLAYAELYLTIACLACKFDMELYDTTVDHVQVHRVRLLGYPRTNLKVGSRQGQVMVKINQYLNS